MITNHWDLGVPYFQVQTHSCCQIRERELVVDPPERDEKKPVLANCLMLMPNVIETEINIYINVNHLDLVGDRVLYVESMNASSEISLQQTSFFSQMRVAS